MKTVELVYDRDCPNIVQTRAALLKAFVQARIQPKWVEWDRSDPESPDYVQGYGSPTILVNKKDIVSLEASERLSQSVANVINIPFILCRVWILSSISEILHFVLSRMFLHVVPGSTRMDNNSLISFKEKPSSFAR